MKKYLRVVLFVIVGFIFACWFTSPSYSDELDDVTKQINDLKSNLNQSVSATKPLESELNKDLALITSIKNQLSSITRDIITKRKNIQEGYKDFDEKEKIMNATIREFYIQSSYDSPLLVFLSAGSASEITRTLAYQQAARDQNKAIITNLALSITDLEEKKRVLEADEKRLIGAKADLDIESAKLDKIITGAREYQAKLNNQIAALSAKQQQLIAAKQASLGLPSSAYTTQGGCSSDLTNGKDPGFSPRIGLFTFGVPHRVGMSQYGAKGRAQAGQNASDILMAYFNNVQLTTVSADTTIHVVGNNEYGQAFDTNWNIEEYVKHIYEIPTDWPTESLKAQAIAARSYALAVTNNGASAICPSQSCQVVKQEINSDAWKSAVDATKGQVLTQGGNPVKAWFSSTAGGYVHSSSDVGWSDTSWTKNALDATEAVISFDDLKNKAYDKDSPWFYCDWGGRKDFGGTAWLKSDEIADIVNAILLAKADGSTVPHLAQTDKPNPDGTDTWSPDRIRQELQTRNIQSFNSISSGSVDWDKGSGKTTSVTVSGDGHSTSINGNDFKNFFNLRAPSNINIVGPLFNIEVR